jgi:hypothetical protein
MKWPASKVSDHFFVEQMTPESLEIRLQPPNPTVYLYLRYINLSPAWVEVERVHVDVQVAYQQVASGDDHERYRIEQFSVMPAYRYGFDGMHDKKVFIELPIDSGRALNAQQQVDSPNSSGRVQLTLSVYGRCQTGRLEKTRLQMEMNYGTAGLSKTPKL